MRPTQEKVAKIQALCRILKKHPCQEARFLLKVLGVMNAVADVIPLGRLHMRPLQLYLLSQWSMSTQPLSCKVFLNSFFQEHLSWWNSPENLLEGQLLHLPKETEELCMDSSMTGWGATLNTVHMVHGVWDQMTSDSRSINWLVLKTVHLAILHFLDLLKNWSVMIGSDNLATIYNLDKQGGTHSPDLCYLAWEILRLCHQHKILVRVQHLTGKLNVLADQLSRSHKAIPTEWSLCPRVFRAIARELSHPGIDLFATALNHQTQVYISLCPDPNALALDALSVDWSSLPLAYGFPPMLILPNVLQKIRQSSVNIILVAPAWPTQSWFPDLLNLSMAAPLEIPVVPDLLSQTVQRKTWTHRNPGMYNYHAWMLSGIPSKREAFLRRLLTESQSRNDPLPDPSMTGSGQNSVLGVVGRKQIWSRPLFL